MVGQVGIGGDNPIRVQSMITCDTMDTAQSIQQTLDLVAVGCEVVRITAPTVKDAANLEHIVRGLRQQGCPVPIVADIHFHYRRAIEAARVQHGARLGEPRCAFDQQVTVCQKGDEQALHQCFLPDDPALEPASEFRKIPAAVSHGC